jgi:hypothetical protein
LFAECTLHGLVQQAARYKILAHAEGTHANRNTHLKTFFMFCIFHSIAPFPVLNHHLEAYIAFLSQSFVAVGTIKNYILTIRFYHYMLGFDFPNISSLQYQMLFKGIRNTLKHTPVRSLPMTIPILYKLFQTMDLSIELNLVLWTAYLVTFFTCSRKSSIIPKSHNLFDPVKHLQRKDIEIFNGGLIIHIKYSKTMQACEEQIYFPVSSFDSYICPKKAFQLMCQKVPAPPDSPAFVFYTKAGLKSVGYDLFVKNIKENLQKAGIKDAHMYKGHSFRRGAASAAYALGMSSDTVMKFGKWRSDAYKLYLEESFDTKLSITRSFAPLIQNCKPKGLK